jgi:hypothetical protein
MYSDSANSRFVNSRSASRGRFCLQAVRDVAHGNTTGRRRRRAFGAALWLPGMVGMTCVALGIACGGGGGGEKITGPGNPGNPGNPAPATVLSVTVLQDTAVNTRVRCTAPSWRSMAFARA